MSDNVSIGKQIFYQLNTTINVLGIYVLYLVEVQKQKCNFTKSDNDQIKISLLDLCTVISVTHKLFSLYLLATVVTEARPDVRLAALGRVLQPVKLHQGMLQRLLVVGKITDISNYYATN